MEAVYKAGIRQSCAKIFAGSALFTPNRIVMQLQSLRLMSGRRDCDSKDLDPRCSPQSLAKSPCVARKKKEKEREKKLGKSPFKSLWENPECCLDPCPDMYPRFDELYYRPSDKSKRVYTITWVECPKRKIVPKLVCNYAQLGLPPINKRKSCDKRPDTACERDGCGKKNAESLKCASISLPGCKGALKPPKCRVVREVTPCKKVCCPYPSYSECKKPPPNKARVTECGCLRTRSACSVFNYLRRQILAKGDQKTK